MGLVNKKQGKGGILFIWRTIRIRAANSPAEKVYRGYRKLRCVLILLAFLYCFCLYHLTSLWI